jgi:hypothetical protein
MLSQTSPPRLHLHSPSPKITENYRRQKLQETEIIKIFLLWEFVGEINQTYLFV